MKIFILPLFILFFSLFINNYELIYKNIYKNIYCNISINMNSNELPNFTNFKIDEIEKSLTGIISQLETDFDILENKIKKEDNKNNFYNLTIYEREKIGYSLNNFWSITSHLNSVRNSNDLRIVYEKMLPKIITISNTISQSKILYDGLEKSLQQDLTPIQKRIINKELQSMKTDGVNLNDKDKKTFLDISLKLADLSNKFRNNVLDSINNYKMVIDTNDKKNMNKMPESALELFSEKAKTEGYDDTTPKDGPWIVTLDGPSYIAFMTHYPNSDKRKELYKVSIQKASKGDLDNSKLIIDILETKDELSKLLDFKNYVDLSLSEKMASYDEIDKLLNSISKKSITKGKEDYDEIVKYSKLEKVELWDSTYYLEKMMEDKLKFKEEDLKPYLVFENVLDGLFTLSEKIFNIKIIEVKKGIDVWHPDVKYFNLYDVSNLDEHIASFYLDPFVRPGQKKGGAWMDECIGKSKNLNKFPVAYLILNGTPPLNGKPSLMTLGEMETLFHEFGHGLQHMLTTVDEASSAGISNVEWDAVELPSQFMENWCYHKKTLMSFAKHYQTKEVLPDDLFNKIIKQKTYHVANGINRQIYFSMLDLYIHKNKITDIHSIQKKISKKYLVKDIDEDDKFLCAFEHIFAGGYSAGYYSYKWAEIMSLDAFSAFEEIDMDNDKEIKKLGLKFRNTILSKGGGTDPLTVFKEFRGREPKTDAFMKNYGLL